MRGQPIGCLDSSNRIRQLPNPDPRLSAIFHFGATLFFFPGCLGRDRKIANGTTYIFGMNRLVAVSKFVS